MKSIPPGNDENWEEYGDDGNWMQNQDGKWVHGVWAENGHWEPDPPQGITPGRVMSDENMEYGDDIQDANTKWQAVRDWMGEDGEKYVPPQQIRPPGTWEQFSGMAENSRQTPEMSTRDSRYQQQPQYHQHGHPYSHQHHVIQNAEKEHEEKMAKLMLDDLLLRVTNIASKVVHLRTDMDNTSTKMSKTDEQVAELGTALNLVDRDLQKIQTDMLAYHRTQTWCNSEIKTQEEWLKEHEVRHKEHL